MEYFTNPYNFVPFTGTCQREPLNLGPQECMTGYFECELELLTPLFIPNTSNKYALCSEEERPHRHRRHCRRMGRTVPCCAEREEQEKKESL